MKKAISSQLSAILFYDQTTIIRQKVSGDSLTAHFKDLNDRKL